jgi:hypothetical protein
VPRGNEGEHKYGSKNLGEEICENKSDSAQEETTTITLAPQNLLNFDYSDPALWPPVISNKIWDMIVERGPLIIQDPNYYFSHNSENRYFSIYYYKQVLPNGEVSTRHWLVYSVTMDKVFYFCCKLFKSSNLKSNLSEEGINNWKHISEYLKVARNIF